MTYVLRIAVLIAVLGCACQELAAADYYVDFAGGSDARAGTSEAQAWKHCPGDQAATGLAASTALAPGDKVLFKAGTIYETSGIWVVRPGAPGNPIIYDGGAWGNGARCIITTQNKPGSLGMGFGGKQRKYITIRRLHFKDIGGYKETDPIWNEPPGGWVQSRDAVKSPQNAPGITMSNANHCVISECKFEKIGQWRNVKPMSGTNSVTGFGVSLQNVDSITIENCEFTRMKTGVSLKAHGAQTGITSNILIKNCSFHNSMNWLIDIAPRSNGATLRNIVIDGNTFYNYKEFDRPNWKGWGDKPHQDGIFIRSSGMTSTWDNIVLKNNLFYSDDYSDGGTASVFISQGPSVTLYNNVFCNDYHANGELKIGYANATGQKQVVRVLNNTFVGSPRPLIINSSERTNPDVLDVRNNLFYRFTSGINDCWLFSAFRQVGELIVDNNIYCSNNVPLENTVAVFNGSRLSFAEWQALGFDPNGNLANPQLVGISGPPSTWNPRPAGATSPLVNAGADLSAFFTTDKDGNPRTGAFDVGAYEFQGGGDVGQHAPEIPRFLRASVLSPTSIQLTWQDASSNETGFQLEKSLTGGSGYSVAATLPPNTQTFTVEGLLAGTTYFFRVRAFNDLGNSGYSNVANATTSQDPGDPEDPGESGVAVGVEIPAASGQISQPFQVTGGEVWQAVQTVDYTGGRAVYYIEVTEAGEYAVAIKVNTPDEGSNSLFVDFDKEPEIPVSVWHIPVTSGYKWIPVTWQGNGTVTDPEFTPKFFQLDPGVHELVVRGREANAKFRALKVVKRLPPPNPGPRHP